MTRVYLVRHGTTEWNREEIFRGRADCPLNETGRAEARAVAHYLQGMGIEKIYSSPLSRAAETAQAVAAAAGVPVIFKASFTDLDFGDWRMPLREVKKNIPKITEFGAAAEDANFPGNLKQVRIRACQDSWSPSDTRKKRIVSPGDRETPDLRRWA
jgi:broad specificity phosphatase PhoE